MVYRIVLDSPSDMILVKRFLIWAVLAAELGVITIFEMLQDV